MALFDELLKKAQAQSAVQNGTDQLSEIDNADFAQYQVPGIPQYEGTSIPLQAGLSNAELAAQQSAPVESKVDRAPAVMPSPRVNRAPASIQESPEEAAQAKPETDIQRLERLMSGLNDQRRKDIDDAASRQLKGNLINALASNIGNIVGGAQAMNTKASVTPAKVQGIELPDLQAIVEKKYKPEQEQLMAQYKALKDANQPMTEYQRQMLAGMAEQRDIQRLNAQNAMERFGKTHDRLLTKQEWQEQEKNELSDKQTDALTAYDDTKAAFARIKSAKEKIDTGPFASKRNQLASAVGVDDPDVTSLKAELIDTLAQKIKALSGTAANESEVKRLQVTLPELSDNDKVFERKLADAERRVEEARQIRTEAFRKQGKDPSRFENKPSGTVRIQGPSGQVATVSAEKAEKYLSQPGYKKVD